MAPRKPKRMRIDGKDFTLHSLTTPTSRTYSLTEGDAPTLWNTPGTTAIKAFPLLESNAHEQLSSGGFNNQRDSNEVFSIIPLL